MAWLSFGLLRVTIVFVSNASAIDEALKDLLAVIRVQLQSAHCLDGYGT